MTRAVRALLALCAVALACRSVPVAVPLPPDDPRPAAWLAQLADEVASRRALRATARVSLDGQRGASFARQILLLERPARLRVEVLGLLGQRVAVLAAADGIYDLYRAETGVVEQGAVHPGILAEVAGVPLTPEEAVELLLGAPPVAGALRSAAALEPGGLRLWLEGPHGAPRLLELDDRGRLRRYAVGAGEERFVDVRYEDYRPVDGHDFAHRVALDFPASGAAASVEFRAVELNPALPESLFRLAPVGSVSSGVGGTP